MTTKHDWHHQVEHERSLFELILFFLQYKNYLVPANEVYETNNGKTIPIEYREENGTIYKVSNIFKRRFL
jgi:hypothetical protein